MAGYDPMNTSMNTSTALQTRRVARVVQALSTDPAIEAAEVRLKALTVDGRLPFVFEASGRPHDLPSTEGSKAAA